MNPINLPDGYVPSIDEDFMNPMQVEYFRRKLVKWREHICKEYGLFVDLLKKESFSSFTKDDRAIEELEVQFGLMSKERAIKLVKKIDHALMKISKGEYGYCEATGQPIALERLKARPVAVFSIQAQESHEKFEREHAE